MLFRSTNARQGEVTNTFQQPPKHFNTSVPSAQIRGSERVPQDRNLEIQQQRSNPTILKALKQNPFVHPIVPLPEN